MQGDRFQLERSRPRDHRVSGGEGALEPAVCTPCALRAASIREVSGMRKGLLLPVLLVVGLGLAPSAFGQAGVDPDACPGVSGTASGCPDQDGDGIADQADKCPSLTNRNGPDRNRDGCAETISLLRVTFDGNRACSTCPWTSIRVTSLSLEFLTPRTEARFRLLSGACRHFRQTPNFLTCTRPVSRSLGPGIAFRATVSNAAGDREVHTVRISRRGAPKVTTRR